MQTGTRLGDYTVEAFIDEGAIAEIYRARHVGTGRLVALKLLRTRSPEVRDRLGREGRALIALSHPHLVAVTEVLSHNGYPALVMEYIDGPTLEEWLEDEVPSLRERERVFGQIAGGVAHVHDAGMVHRDLQPANVLIVSSPEGPVAKIIDFGLVKSSEQGLTRPGATMGTPGFMAPEQITNALLVDARSDIFSLGCLLYFLVCDCEPFEGSTELEVLNATLTCRYPSPLMVAPGPVPRRMVSAISGALKRAPPERWSSVGELLRTLAGQS